MDVVAGNRFRSPISDGFTAEMRVDECLAWICDWDAGEATAATEDTHGETALRAPSAPSGAAPGDDEALPVKYRSPCGYVESETAGSLTAARNMPETALRVNITRKTSPHVASCGIQFKKMIGHIELYKKHDADNRCKEMRKHCAPNKQTS